MGAYLGKISFGVNFEFLTENGTIDHAELGQQIKNLTSKKILVTMATRKTTVLDNLCPLFSLSNCSMRSLNFSTSFSLSFCSTVTASKLSLRDFSNEFFPYIFQPWISHLIICLNQ